jgi:hypothetical protein
MNQTRDRRIILLLGAPRSGTSWLAKILDTYPSVWYCHEPMKGSQIRQLHQLVTRVKPGELQFEERPLLLNALAAGAYFWMRPPFFPKSFLRIPPKLLLAAWTSVKLLRRSYRAFNYSFRPSPELPYDLLIKEVDWQGQSAALIKALQPDHLIILVRHPCAVVNSRLQGVCLGLMKDYRAGWLERNEERCRQLGYAPDAVREMADYEFFALRWLLSNQEYQALVHAHGKAITIRYEDLCRDPLGVARFLFTALDWEMSPVTERFVRHSSSGGLRAWLTALLRRKRDYYGLYRNSTTTVQSWQQRLTPAQQRRILAITGVTADPFEWTSPLLPFPPKAAQLSDVPSCATQVVANTALCSCGGPLEIP